MSQSSPSANEHGVEPAEILREGPHISLARRGGWEFVTRLKPSGVVAVVAVTEARELVLVEQHRPPIGKRMIELPAGMVGDEASFADESLLDGARRELFEETGYRSELWRELFTAAPSAGLTDEQLTFFLAEDARREGEGGGDAAEDIHTHVIPLGEVEAFVASCVERGMAVDLKIYAGLWAAQQRSA